MDGWFSNLLGLWNSVLPVQSWSALQCGSSAVLGRADHLGTTSLLAVFKVDAQHAAERLSSPPQQLVSHSESSEVPAQRSQSRQYGRPL
eukprot:2704108-Amphidinium_carterae.1